MFKCIQHARLWIKYRPIYGQSSRQSYCIRVWHFDAQRLCSEYGDHRLGRRCDAAAAAIAVEVVVVVNATFVLLPLVSLFTIWKQAKERSEEIDYFQSTDLLP